MKTERAIQHEDFTLGVASQYRFSRIRVVFPEGFDVCDSVIGIQGNMSGVTIRSAGSEVTRNLRFYKASSTTSQTRGITEPSITVQKTAVPIPKTGTVLSHLRCTHYTKALDIHWRTLLTRMLLNLQVQPAIFLIRHFLVLLRKFVKHVSWS